MPIDLVSQLVGAAIRAFGLGLVAFAGLSLYRIRSSAARHATWTVVLGGMLLQIPLGMVAPTVPLKVLPTLPARLQPSTQPRVTESARPFAPAIQTAVLASRIRTGPKGRWVSPLAGVYLAISMLLFIRMALGSWTLRRILRHAMPIPGLGPDIFESALSVVPGSVGCLRARILLPQTWRDWNAAKLRSVLAHERAHIRRQDWLIRVASHVNGCIFWFHPLAWWMERELARLAEEACDDVALSEVEDRDEYAATLVDIALAAAADGGVLNWRIISMAKDSNVARRVNRILEARLPIPKPFGRLACVTLLACSLPMIYLSASVKLLERPAIPAGPAEGARLPILPEQKSSVKLIAQAAPNQPVRPAPPLTPPPREDLPITMCIAIDNSGSMFNKREGVKAAALALMRASKPGDEVCLVDFNDETYLDLEFTGDIGKMEGALARFDSRGGKAIRDAVRMSLDHLAQRARNNRKVLVLVTEGNDTASTVSQEQLLSEVRNSGVRVYSIGLVGEDDLRKTDAAKLALGQLAEASGGMAWYPRDLAEVESISAEITTGVRKQ